MTVAFAGDPVFIESPDSVTHTNTDAIDATGDGQKAYKIVSGGDITATNSGALTSLNNGVRIVASDTANFTNSGTISSSDEAIIVFGHESATTINSGQLTSIEQYGISTISFGDVSVENSEEINANVGISASSMAGTLAFNDTGIENSDSADGGAVTIKNQGDISLNSGIGEQATISKYFNITHNEIGIIGSATNGFTSSNEGHVDEFSTPLETNPDGLNVSITNTGNIADASAVDKATSLSVGIGAAALGDVLLNNKGAISTGKYGIVLEAGGKIDAANEGDITLTNGSAVISLDTNETLPDEDGGNITLNNSGNISAQSAVEAIDVDSRGAAIVTNSGDIKGGSYVGIEVEAASTVDVTNSGKIETTGYNSDGIAASSETTTTVKNSGEIKASDAGIRAGSFGLSTATNQKDGYIHGGNVGIDVGSGGGSVITNAGKIEADEIGIIAISYGGSFKNTKNDDDDEEVEGNETTISLPGGEVKILNSGTITMVEPDSYENDVYELDGHKLPIPSNVAIFAVSKNGGARSEYYTDENNQEVEDRDEHTPLADDAANNAVTVNNTGTIDGTVTNWSHGIYAMASDGVDIDNSGNITVGAAAISAIGNSPVTIENSGIIKIYGEFGTDGVRAISGHYYEGIVGEAVSIENSGTIDLTGAGENRRAVRAWSNGGTSTIINSGSVITTADGARGLHASSGAEGACEYDSAGNCTRIQAVDGGIVTLNSSGSVSTSGDNARAVSGWSHGGAINITTSGALTTKGDSSQGIQAQSGERGGDGKDITPKKGGAITIINSAVIGTEGENSYGVNAFSNGGTVDVTNAGKITTEGEGAVGINLSSGNNWLGNGGEASDGAAVTLTNNAGGDISTSANEARGIQAGSTNGNITIANNAKLSTLGNNAGGINVYSGSNRQTDDSAIFKGGTVSISNSAVIETEGQTATGLNAWSNGETVAIDNTGAISTKGEKSRGIGAYSGTYITQDNRVTQAGSDITVSNAGSVTTEGDEAHGIETFSNGGAIQIDLGANSAVSTTGDKGRGLSVGSGNSLTTEEKILADGGNIVANINGLLSTTGESANAVDIWTNGGNITLTAAAGTEISTEAASSFGVRAKTGEIRTTGGYEAHDGGTINITSAAAVSTKGDGSTALSAVSANNTVTVNNSGTLTATGNGLEGIAAYSGSEEDSTAGQNAIDGKKVTITNSGSVTLSGSESVAIAASSQNNVVSIVNSGALKAGTSATDQEKNAGIVVMRSSLVTVENSGAISVKGDEAIGLLAVSKESTQITNTGDINADGMLSLAGISAGDVAIENSGDLTLNRSMAPENDWNGALMALSNSNVNIANTGDISTTGAGMRAIHSSRAPSDIGGDDTHPDNVTIENSGKLATDGTEAHGIYAESSGAVAITNTGDSVVSGDGANGLVSLAETTTDITNTGIISSTGGLAIVTGKSADTITNSGSFIGGAMFGDNTDTLTNTGKLEGKFEFGGGDDVLNLNAGSVFKDATFDGGDGTDNANFSGSGTLDEAEFKNFETASIADGSWSLSNTMSAFQTFNVADKGTLVLNNGVLGAAQINLLAGSTITGSGTISGGVTNNGSILLASSDTLKIEGDFHSATGSKLEFALGGSDGSTHSKLEVTGGKFTFDSSDVFNIAVDANTDLAESSRYKVATADGGVDDLSTTSDGDAVNINDSSAAFAFERTIEDKAVWIAARATISDAVTELAPELAAQAGAVEEFVVDSGAGGALAEQLNGLNETQLVAAVAELTTPNEAAGHQSLNSTVSTANNIVDNRIAGRISGSSQRNFYTGNPANDPNTQNSYRANAGHTEASKVVMAYGGEGIVGSRWLDEGGYTQAWAQAFWGNTKIDNSKSNQYGTSVGLDFRPDQNTLIGGSFSYSRTDADATNSSLEADTYGGMLYGAKGLDSGLAFSGVIGYFLSQNTSKRQALGSNYSGSFDSNTFTLSGNVSQEIDLQHAWLFTPNAGVRYSHATFDDYQETGGVAPLMVSRNDVDSVELSAEASFTRNFNVTETTKGLFEFHLGGLYEAGDNDSTVAYRFSPTGAMLYNNTEVARLKFNTGALVEIPFSDQISTEFAYEGTFASDYADHLLRAKFKVKF